MSRIRSGGMRCSFKGWSFHLRRTVISSSSSFLWLLLLLSVDFVQLSEGGNVEGVDDSILFKMRWKPPLPSLDPLPDSLQDHDMIRMMSSDQEPYVCFVPKKLQVKATEATTRNYDGPTPLELLEPLLVNRVCRYKLDHYWTYQLCHGKSLRQYHEDTTSTKVQIVEFYLGKYDLDMMKADNEKYKADFAQRLKSPTLSRIPTVKIDGVDHPYFAVNMSYGTLCDINQRPRSTQVWYVCDQMSDHDIHSFEEPASCTYRVVVRTPFLCKHPDYRVEVAPENEISCHPEHKTEKTVSDQLETPAEIHNDAKTISQTDNEDHGQCMSSPENVDINPSITGGGGQDSRQPPSSCQAQPSTTDAPSRPMNDVTDGFEPLKLREMIRENREFREHALQESDGGSLEDDVKIYYDEEERTLKIFFLPQEDEPRPDSPPPHDQRHVERFLTGSYCLQGGTGWWKYEFCYGKRVSQFHVEKGERTQEILLGQWNQKTHKAWVDANRVRKATVKGSNHVTHFYSSGDICQVTERPRTVKVKLICKSIKGHPDAVSIFLQEPKPCEYTLTVESSIVCHILDNVDDYGLPSDETLVDNHYLASKLNNVDELTSPATSPMASSQKTSRQTYDHVTGDNRGHHRKPHHVEGQNIGDEVEEIIADDNEVKDNSRQKSQVSKEAEENNKERRNKRTPWKV